MRLISFIVAMNEAQSEIYRAVEGMAHGADTRQWVKAGTELGRIEATAKALAALARIARHAVYDEIDAATVAVETEGPGVPDGDIDRVDS